MLNSVGTPKSDRRHSCGRTSWSGDGQRFLQCEGSLGKALFLAMRSAVVTALRECDRAVAATGGTVVRGGGRKGDVACTLTSDDQQRLLRTRP